MTHFFASVLPLMRRAFPSFAKLLPPFMAVASTFNSVNAVAAPRIREHGEPAMTSVALPGEWIYRINNCLFFERLNFRTSCQHVFLYQYPLNLSTFCNLQIVGVGAA